MLRHYLMFALFIMFSSAASAAFAAAPPERSAVRAFALSGDGQSAFYLASDGAGEQLLRVQTRMAAAPEKVMDWPPGAIRFATATSGDVILLMSMDAAPPAAGGPPGMGLTLARRTSSGWIKQPLMSGVAVSGFENSRDESFHVMLQPGPDQFERVSFAADGTITGRQAYALPALDLIYGPNLTPRLYLDAATEIPRWRQIIDGSPGPEANLPDSISIESFLFASNEVPEVFALARTQDSDELRAISIDWVRGATTSFAAQPGLDVDAVVRSVDGNRVDAVRFERETPRTRNIDPSLGQDLIFLASRFGLEPEIMARSNDDSIWLLRVGRADRPAQYWAHDHRLKTSLRLDPAPADENALIVPPASYRTVNTDDGQPLATYLSQPTRSGCDSAGKRCPLVVLIHGGPTRRDRMAYDPEVAWLQRQGFWVLRVNYRGSAGYGLKFRRAGDREWGGRMIDDINQATRAVLAASRIDKRRITAMGASYGGFAALSAAVKDPGLYRCSVSINGGGDLVQFARSGKQRDPALARGIAMQVGDPDIPADFSRIESQSPLTHVGRMRAKVLQVVSMKDTITDPLQSLNFDVALRDAGKKPHLLQLDEGDHGITAPADRERTYDELAKFLKTCR